MNLWWTIRSKGGAATMAVGVLAVAGLATAVPVLTRPAGDQQPAGEAYVVGTEAPAATTEAPAPAAVTAAVPQEQAVATGAPSIDTVTEPAPQTPEQPQPAEGVGSTGANGYYTPAPPRVNPGEPPVGNIGSSGAGGEPLPGEPGYTGDAVVPQIPTR